MFVLNQEIHICQPNPVPNSNAQISRIEGRTANGAPLAVRALPRRRRGANVRAPPRPSVSSVGTTQTNGGPPRHTGGHPDPRGTTQTRRTTQTHGGPHMGDHRGQIVGTTTPIVRVGPHRQTSAHHNIYSIDISPNTIAPNNSKHIHFFTKSSSSRSWTV